uniref:Uncharacterized protein n=1 Tax=Molossus molossus TaxID=27622 RepID=A0A7J8G0A2_MOLMO|nr:hypothetical protein HJG59_008173 [Molossus molossus]
MCPFHVDVSLSPLTPSHSICTKNGKMSLGENKKKKSSIIFFSLLILERGEGRGRDRNINERTSTGCFLQAPIRDLAHNMGMGMGMGMGMRSDWESNQRPLGAWVNSQPLSHTNRASLYSYNNVS